jgi:hypothetical protein
MTFPFVRRFRFHVARSAVLTLVTGSTALPVILIHALVAVSQPAISPSFSPNPLVLRGTGGGTTPIAEIVDRSNTETGPCTGFANPKPDQTLVVNSFFKTLSLQVASSDDTSLAIKGPGGVWCNDDNNGKDPGISGEWLPGTYSIWVASYSQNRSPAYTLQIREKR